MSMKTVFAFMLLIMSTVSVFAQTGEEILHTMYEKINQLESVSYEIHKVDTFVSGSVQIKSGKATLKKNTQNPKFPFLFYGADNSMYEFLFDGEKALAINHKDKSLESVQSLHYRTFLGYPGGQMILEELLLPEIPYDSKLGYGYTEISYEELPDCYVLTIRYADNHVYDVRNRFKKIHVSKESHLPFYRYHFLENSFGERQVNEATLSNIRINDKSVSMPDIDYETLASYKELKQGNPVSRLAELYGTNAPNLELENINGGKARLSDMKGKVVLLNFWEIWCGPCIESIPRIKELAIKYPEEEFEIWSIASDEKTFSKLKLFAEQRNLNYAVFYGSKEDAEKYYVYGVPEYVIIDKNGIIQFVTAGYSENIEIELNKLLLK